MKRILIVKTTSMGDVIHALPVIADIIKYFPDAHIDWLVEESFADIPRMHPHIQQVFIVAVRRWRKQWFRSKTWQEICTVKRALGVDQYDAILDLQGLVKSAIMATWAYGPRYGYGKHTARESLARYFYQYPYEIAFSQHAVTRMRCLTASVLGYEVPDGPPEYGLSSSRHSTRQPAFLVLHASSLDRKLWPEQHWIALGQVLANQGLQMWLPWASAEEQARAQRIAAQVPLALVMPKLSLGELVNQMRQVCFAIGVDTGLSHLAAALDIPVVALYTDTDPELTGVKKGPYAAAINLGGRGQTPSVSSVIAQVTAIMPTLNCIL